MKSVGVIGVAVFAVAAIAVAVFFFRPGRASDRPADDPGPHIACEDRTVDFGPMYSEEHRTHTFTIKNIGKSELEITDVKVQCGCTTPTFKSRRIPPSGSTEMAVGFTPPGGVDGAIEKHIFVKSNDPYEKEYSFKVTAIGLGPAHMEPSAIEWSGIVPNRGFEREIVMTLPEGEVFAGIEFYVHAPWITIEVPPVLGERKAKFVVRLSHLREKITLRESIQGLVTAERAGQRRQFPLSRPIQITGTVEPEAAAEPPVVHFGAVAPGVVVERRIKIRPPKDGAWTVTSKEIGCDPKSSSATDDAAIEVVEDKNDPWTSILRFSAKKSGRYAMTLSVNHGDESILVPCVATVY